MNNFFMKQSKLGVNISSTFMAKSRCKKCGSPPQYNRYFYFQTSNFFKSPRKQSSLINFLKKHFKRMCEDYYLSNYPSRYNSVSPFSHSASYKGFVPKLHKNKGVSATENYTEIITCYCGRTTWAFYQKSAENRPEIINKKGRFNY